MNSHENAGPPEALLAIPTNYRNYAADGSGDLDRLSSAASDELSPLEDGCARDVVIDDPEGETAPSEIVAKDPKGKNLEPESLGLPASAEQIGGSHGEEEGSVQKSPGALSKGGVDTVFPHDIVKPNPAFGDASNPVSQKIGVLNEDYAENKDDLIHISVPETEEVRSIPE